MPRIFSFEPAECDLPAIWELREYWKNIPDHITRNAVATTHQYLKFHMYLVESIRHADPVAPDKRIPIGLSVRAGAVKTAVMICGSIIEAVLRAHAEKRGIKLDKEPNRRTLGNVIYSWKKNEQQFSVIAPIWEDLKVLLDSRNDIHLYKSIDEKEFDAIVVSEEQLLNKARKVVTYVQQLTSP